LRAMQLIVLKDGLLLLPMWVLVWMCLVLVGKVVPVPQMYHPWYLVVRVDRRLLPSVLVPIHALCEGVVERHLDIVYRHTGNSVCPIAV